MRGFSAQKKSTVAQSETNTKSGRHFVRMYFFVSLTLLVLLTAYGLVSGYFF